MIISLIHQNHSGMECSCIPNCFHQQLLRDKKQSNQFIWAMVGLLTLLSGAELEFWATGRVFAMTDGLFDASG